MAQIAEKKCYVVPDVASDALKRSLAKRRCVEVSAREDADAFIAADPNETGQRVLWHAVCRGAVVMTPKFPETGGGPVIKYKCASAVSRKIFMTTKFQEKHGEIKKIIEASSAAAGSKWTLLKTLEDCCSCHSKRCS